MGFEDMEFVTEYLTQKLGTKLGGKVPSREQARNFIKFLKLGDHR
jgi:hypothetical protein